MFMVQLTPDRVYKICLYLLLTMLYMTPFMLKSSEESWIPGWKGGVYFEAIVVLSPPVLLVMMGFLKNNITKRHIFSLYLLSAIVIFLGIQSAAVLKVLLTHEYHLLWMIIPYAFLVNVPLSLIFGLYAPFFFAIGWFAANFRRVKP